jgi:hypothetical protein
VKTASTGHVMMLLSQYTVLLSRLGACHLFLNINLNTQETFVSKILLSAMNLWPKTYYLLYISITIYFNIYFQVQEQMRSGQIELEKYVITKSLTKAPEDYPDAKNQPHVQVRVAYPCFVLS